jgi:hypothetical protein
VSSGTEDPVAIHELFALHRHLFDCRQLDRLHELFTEDVIYDVVDLGGSICTVVCEDVMSRTAQRWRLAARRVRLRRRPPRAVAIRTAWQP